MRYTFQHIDHCNMCGSTASHHHILGKRLNSSQGKNPTKKTGITTTVVKCSVCGLIFSNPMPIPFDIQDHYGVPPENYWKEDYFQIKNDAFDHDFERLRKLISLRENPRFLDVGAGLGKQMLYYQNKGFDVYGFEPSKPFYERAISKMGLTSHQLKLGQIETINYPTNEFDFISFGVVLEHLYNPSEALNKALTWLKPSGIIHIEVPSASWLINKLINLYYRLKMTDYVGNISPMHPPYHLYEFSLDSFLKNGKINNYSVVHHDIYICSTFMPKILDVPLKTLMKKTGTGMQLSVWLRKSE